MPNNVIPAVLFTFLLYISCTIIGHLEKLLNRIILWARIIIVEIQHKRNICTHRILISEIQHPKEQNRTGKSLRVRTANEANKYEHLYANLGEHGTNTFAEKKAYLEVEL